MSIGVENATLRFGQHTALDGVSLDVAGGELLALLGPSGCGKTSLLRLIAGLEKPQSGEVYLHGEPVGKLDVRDRRVGFVFQHYALFRHMTVFENVAFGLRVKRWRQRPKEDAIREKVEVLLDKVQLSAHAQRYPDQLSGGQRQRVALARALVTEPRVLLLDEPFAALDAEVRKTLRRWLRRFHEEWRITTVFVTHDQEEALEVADRVVVMNHGKVEQVGTPAELYDHPQSAFVCRFLGEVHALAGRVADCRLWIGNRELGPAPILAPAGPATLYVRPHDFALIEPQHAPLLGCVRDVRVLGSRLLVSVLLEGLQTGPIDVDLARDDRSSDLHEGKVIGLLPQRAHWLPNGGT